MSRASVSIGRENCILTLADRGVAKPPLLEVRRSVESSTSSPPVGEREGTTDSKLMSGMMSGNTRVFANIQICGLGTMQRRVYSTGSSRR